MSNKHITHTDGSHFDISIAPNKRFEGEHTLTFRRDEGLSTALRLNDNELNQLVEAVQNYKNTRDGIGYTFTLDARDVDNDIKECLNRNQGPLRIYNDEEERVLRDFLQRDDAERRSIISDTLQYSVDTVHDVDFYEAVDNVIDTTINIIVANLSSKKH